jgi:ribonuclease-3
MMSFLSSGSLPRERRDALILFQRRIGIKFKDIALLDASLTHRSVCHKAQDSGKKQNNERLEFLGDSILGFCVAEFLYQSLPEKSEGDLAKIKSFVVSEGSLSKIALDLQIDEVLLIGKGEENSGGRTKKAILADALEAVIGAYYLDAGFKSAQRFVLGLIQDQVADVLQGRHEKDYKTLLQEFTQKRYHVYPLYKVLSKSGPDHDQTFLVEVGVKGEKFGPASGKSKKEAEQKAAKLACDALLLEKE